MSVQMFGSPQPRGADSGAAPAPVAPAVPAAPADSMGAPVVQPAAQPAAPTDGTPNPAPVAPGAPSGIPSSLPSLGDEPVVPASTPAPTGKESENSGIEAHLTGDPGMDLAMNFIAGLGFTPDSNEVKLAVEKGNFDLLEAKLAAMGDKASGWKEHVALAKAYLEAEDAKFEAKITECYNAVYEACGGAEEWKKISTWAKSVADPNEEKEINAMLSSGKHQAKAAALYLRGLYEKAAGTVVEPASPIQGAAPTNQAGQSALSPEEFRAELSSLVARKGTYIDNDPEYKSLMQRRAAYRG